MSKAEATANANDDQRTDNTDDETGTHPTGEAGEDGGGSGEGGGEDNPENADNPEGGDGEPGDDPSAPVSVTIEGDSPTQEEEDEHTRAPAWVKELRQSHREQKQRIRELESQLAKPKQTETHPVDPGPKPTLAGCDYDATEFATKLEAWHTAKAKADKAAQDAEQAQRQQEGDWQKKLSTYNGQKAALRVEDFADAEDSFKDAFDQTQQGIVIHGAKNAAVVVYALGKNAKKAAELAAIKDPISFAMAVRDLENKLKVTPRKAPPPPETRVRAGGSSPATSAVDSTLERLRADAARTGDYSKVHQFKRQQRGKAT